MKAVLVAKLAISDLLAGFGAMTVFKFYETNREFARFGFLVGIGFKLTRSSFTLRLYWLMLCGVGESASLL